MDNSIIVTYDKNGKQMRWESQIEYEMRQELFEKMKKDPGFIQEQKRIKWIQETLKKELEIDYTSNKQLVELGIYIQLNLLDENETLMQGDKQLGLPLKLSPEFMNQLLWGKPAKK